MRRVNAVLHKLAPSPDLSLALDVFTVKLQRRVSQYSTTLDDLYRLWIEAATQIFEEETGRQLIIAPYEYWLDACPPSDRFIELPKPPLQAVHSVTYLDASEDEQTFAADNYTVTAPSGPYCAPGRIVLNDGASWPTTSQRERAVRVTFTAGYGDTPEELPATARAALLYLVGHFHRNSEEVVGGQEAVGLHKIPLGASAMMAAFKYSALPTQRPWEVSWLD